ncbi:hypothetical protein Tco_0651894 [Tanacetum coccineum]|uniref:Uncharacterized protein n=1 Tax=Tanacetum coccineum TaxID=301880 RepID=A0ABQ4WWD2_9ASTR
MTHSGRKHCREVDRVERCSKEFTSRGHQWNIGTRVSQNMNDYEELASTERADNSRRESTREREDSASLCVTRAGSLTRLRMAQLILGMVDEGIRHSREKYMLVVIVMTNYRRDIVGRADHMGGDVCIIGASVVGAVAEYKMDLGDRWLYIGVFDIRSTCLVKLGSSIDMSEDNRVRWWRGVEIR